MDFHIFLANHDFKSNLGFLWGGVWISKIGYIQQNRLHFSTQVSAQSKTQQASCHQTEGRLMKKQLRVRLREDKQTKNPKVDIFAKKWWMR